MRFISRVFWLSVICCVISPARAQDPVSAFPKNYSAVLENEVVSVIRVHYGPHERIGVHDHSRFPTVYVYLNDSGPVRFVHDETPAFAMTRKPTTAGGYRVSPGRLERHIVENLSDKPSDFLRIELKHVPLHSGLHEFRRQGPVDLSHASDDIEFRSPQFDIERIVRAPGATYEIAALPASSLLIALSRLTLRTQPIPPGGVQWLPASQTASIRALSNEPAQLLRIAFRNRASAHSSPASPAQLNHPV